MIILMSVSSIGPRKFLFLFFLNHSFLALIFLLRFWLRCEFPGENSQAIPHFQNSFFLTFVFFTENLNCSIGIGLEAALGRVLVISFFVFVIGPILLPSLMLPLMAFSAFLFFVVVVPAVAWHYSPQCWLMTPSFPLTQGLNVPIWPIPVAFPALPECALDDIVALADKFITDCYSGPGSPMVIPEYLINGELCPADLNTHIDVVNCKDVGVSDGIQNLLFLGVWTLGSGFCDFALQVTATCIGSWWPGLEDYMRMTLESFKEVSDTQMNRQIFCFWATLPTIFLPLVLAFLAFTFIGFIIPAIIELIISIFDLFGSSPVVAGIPGYGQEWFELTMDEPELDERVSLNEFEDQQEFENQQEFEDTEGDAQRWYDIDPNVERRYRQVVLERADRRRQQATFHHRSGYQQARNLMGDLMSDWLFPKHGKRKKE